jgi:hypothetical protein
MEAKLEKLEHGKEKQSYETPQLTKHGSVEQITGFQADQAELSGFTQDGSTSG